MNIRIPRTVVSTLAGLGLAASLAGVPAAAIGAAPTQEAKVQSVAVQAAAKPEVTWKLSRYQAKNGSAMVVNAIKRNRAMYNVYVQRNGGPLWFQKTTTQKVTAVKLPNLAPGQSGKLRAVLERADVQHRSKVYPVTRAYVGGYDQDVNKPAPKGKKKTYFVELMRTKPSQGDYVTFTTYAHLRLKDGRTLRASFVTPPGEDTAVAFFPSVGRTAQADLSKSGRGNSDAFIVGGGNYHLRLGVKHVG